MTATPVGGQPLQPSPRDDKNEGDPSGIVDIGFGEEGLSGTCRPPAGRGRVRVTTDRLRATPSDMADVSGESRGDET